MNVIERLERDIEAIKEMCPKKIIKNEKIKPYTIPSLDYLTDYVTETYENKMDPQALESKLKEFGLEGEVADIKRGPVITRYEIKLSKGVRLGEVRRASEDLALALMSGHIRILAPIPGTNLIGIEVGNEKPDIIGLKSILKNDLNDFKLPMAIGVDTIGNPKIFDLTKMPHLLIAGQTGSGKSVCINSIILSILYTKTPEECQLVLVDPKRVEMSSYKNLPHLRCPVVSEAYDAVDVFNSLITEMENRYQVLSKAKVRNIDSYNEIFPKNKMPYIVSIVDEMSDLMMTSGKELEAMIVRLAQLSRAVGIHLVLATQKPIVKVITGLIKSNLPSRIAFQVASKMDSRVILDTNGAESLVGRGDMLMIYPGASEPERFHGPWVSDAEIQKITESIL